MGTPLADMAAQYHELFLTFRDAGFSEVQAFQFVLLTYQTHMFAGSPNA